MLSSSPNIVSCGKIILTHNIQNPTPIQSYSPHKGIINCVTWNHINKVLSSAGADGKIYLFPAEKPQSSVWQFQFDNNKIVPVNSCAFSSNSKYIAAGGNDSYVKIWELKSSRQLYLTIKNHFGAVTSLAWAKNDEILASSSVMGDVFLHSIKNGAGNIVESFSIKNQEGVNMIKFSQGQSYNRIGACTNGGSVLVWDVTTRSQLCNFQNAHKTSATAISFSSYNPVLMVSTSLDQNMNFYDISQKKAVKTITADQALSSVSFYSDGHTLVTGGMYGGLYVYDLRKPNEPRIKLQGHQSTIRYIDFAKLLTSQKTNKESMQSNPKFTSITSINKNINTKQNNPVIKQQIKKDIFVQKQRTGTSTFKQEKQQEKPQITNKMQKPQYLNKVQPIITNPSIQLPQQQINNLVIQKKIQQKSIYIPNSYNKEQTSNSAIAKQSIVEFQKRLYNYIDEKFQLLHLEMIRQFQIQQNMRQSKQKQLMNENKEKDEEIKKLKIQLEKLKKSSY